MNKTLFAFMALAAAFAATSCQSDDELTQEPTGEPTNGSMVINAVAEGIGAGTRATMAYKYDILWSTGDQIYVKSSTKNAIFTLAAGQETPQGIFACQSSPFESGNAVEAFYPASLVDSGSLVWPAEQTSNTVVPMYSKKTLGSTGSENFSFASLGAVLQIVFTTSVENITLKSITLKDDNATMSGTFTVDENGKACITATDKAGITLDLDKGVDVGLVANYFNIAVPAGTYSNLTITFTATDGSTFTLTGKNVTLNHNTVGRLTLTGKELKPAATTGKAKRTGNIEVKWIQLWKNGPKFAEYNVGAARNKAEDYGGYYCWGSSIDKDSNAAYKSGSDALTGTDDTATNLWGSKWRMPTQAELQALLTNCDVEWTAVGGVNGRKYTGKGAYKDNSVFLPAAGDCLSGLVGGQGYDGYYWSSTPAGSDYAYYLYFASGGQNVYDDDRSYGYSVRAVLNVN